MSTLVINDVTSGGAVAATGAATSILPYSDSADDSAITPFQTVLNDTISKNEEVSKAKKVSGTTNGQTGTTKLENIFKRASEKYDISYDFLVAVAKAESDFNYECVSSAGAKGIMQLMPDEVREFGVTDVFDPEQNIMAAAKLLAAHLKKFNGDFTLAAAAYNAGSGAVQRYGGVPPYNETQNYVKKIAQYMEEGVTVPDKEANATVDYSSYENMSPEQLGSSGAGRVASGDNSTGGTAFDEGVAATDEDWDQVRITVGTGDQAVTMTYGAYLKYKELGSLGVG